MGEEETMLSPVSVIERKRDGHGLTREEIEYLIAGYVDGSVADYQMSAWAMSVFLRGMSSQEIAWLTRAMIASGDVLKAVGTEPRVDKHSTGGLGDKVSLILAPLLAVAGLHVPMISGRGLGTTGGTLDKLEAIPGYRTDLSESEVETQLKSIGCVITGASSKIVPADKKLYALRDVTATVPSIPLITASILSKKTAESLDGLVLDVKYGSGAFMQTEEAARELAESLVRTGKQLGISTSALLTDMTQPLGNMVGNANEVYESIETLQGGGPADVRELTVELSAQLLVQVGKAATLDEARHRLEVLLDDGSAYERFEGMVSAQRGSLKDLPSLAPKSDFTATRSGFVKAMNGQRLGHAVIALGGGRKYVGQAIHPGVGLEMLVRIGDRVDVGQPLLKISAADEATRADALAWIAEAFEIGDAPAASVPLFQRI
jgi:pyrimidine-nucleoside phosphorylase